jgi:outer membrane protein OmpA-like peptidoglycan-associated protein
MGGSLEIFSINLEENYFMKFLKISLLCLLTPLLSSCCFLSLKHGSANAPGLSDVGKVTQTKEGYSILMEGDILFDSGRSQVKGKASVQLRKLADILNSHPKDSLTILGYSDSTGTEESNIKLSTKRALAVKTILVKDGVSASRISTVGKGPADPIADNGTKDGRAKNRRVEMRVKTGK